MTERRCSKRDKKPLFFWAPFRDDEGNVEEPLRLSGGERLRGKRGIVLMMMGVLLTATFCTLFAVQVLAAQGPRIIANCSTLSFDQSRVAPSGTVAALRFNCNDGTRPGFTVAIGKGTNFRSKVHVQFTPRFILPTGYTALYVILTSDLCPAPGSAPIANGQKVTLSNVDYDYCATMDANTAVLAAFDITWS